MDRRRFLALVGGATVAACGGSSNSSSSSAATQATVPGSSHDDPNLVLVPNDWEYFTGTSRLAILLADAKQNGAPLPLDAPVSIRVGPQNGPLGPPIPMVVHANGPEPQYALTQYTFPSAGVYNLQALFKGKTSSLPITVTAPSASATPTVGQPLPSVKSPTAAAPLGVNPICTAQPPCPFHAVSLDQALAAHRPVVLLFATPALCQSRFCGPVLNNLQTASAAWAGKVTFIHSEIYTDLSGQTLTPPAQAYKLEHEPMLYVADATGTIAARVDNLFDQDEARSVLKSVYG